MPFTGFQDFTPEMGNALRQFLAANPGITINSGYRTPERQAELYAQAVQKYGPDRARHYVAPPGKSQHNMRLAADLAFKDDAARKAAHASAAKYGLAFPMGHEPWHIELAGARSGTAPDSRALPDGSTGDTSGLSDILREAAGKRDTYSAIADAGTSGLATPDKATPIPVSTPVLGDTVGALPTFTSAVPETPETRGASAQAFLPGQPGQGPQSLADLFKIAAIGQAGSPVLPSRRF
jgi:hypothetical protein